MTSSITDPTVVHHKIYVDVPRERAFTLFTEEFDRIKPREHNLLDSPIATTVFETHVGGHIYDRGEDGSECRWARVLAFEPPSRFVISWDIGARWQIETDPSHTSEVEVRFEALDESRTRVTLEHRHLDRHVGTWEDVRAGVDGEGGWPTYLRRYADVVTQLEAR